MSAMVDVIIIGILIVLLLIIEISFRILYKRTTGHPWKMIKKIPFRDIYLEPHPYLPYVYKRRFVIRNEMPASYPLHPEGYSFGQYKTNSMRYMNGPDGGREIEVPKPENIIRVACIGASVGALYIRKDGKDYSYPLELESYLDLNFGGRRVEVNNCSAGMRTSAEILIDFALNVIDTQPDIVLYYHGHNDLAPSLTPGFVSDYSHARRNLGEEYLLYRLTSFLPSLPLASYNYLLTQVLGGNIRFSLTRAVTKGEEDISMDFQGMETYRRNVEHIINLCKANGIKIVLSTYCFYLHDGIKNDPKQVKYHEGVLRENEIIKELGRKHNVPVVDMYVLIPQDPSYFLDQIHFTPEGMNLVARSFATEILHIISTRFI